MTEVFSPGKARVSRMTSRHTGTLVGVVALTVALPFLLPAYPLGLFTLAIAYGLFAFGLEIAWGRVGIVSVGHAAFFGLGAYGVAIAGRHDLPAALGILAALAIALMLSIVVGVAGLRNGALLTTMAVITLGVTLLMSQVAISWRSLTNGTNGIFVGGGGVVSRFYITAGLAIAITFLVWLLVFRGSLGKKFLAVLANEQRAAHLGVDPFRTKLTAFIISAMVATVAGAIAAPVMGLVGPSSLGIVMSTQVLVWLAIGGRGTIVGPYLGALLITVGQEYLGAAIGNWYQLLMGVLFILVVKFFPSGIAGLARMAKREPDTEPTARSIVLPAQEPAFEGSDRSFLAVGKGERDGSYALEALDVHKNFGSASVLRGVSLQVGDGEIVCLIGPNGAGKTTLLNVIAGDWPNAEETGTTRVVGKDVSRVRPAARAEAGLGKVFQIPSIFADLTPADNIWLAYAVAHKPRALPPAYRRFFEMTRRPSKDLPLAEKRALELAMVLAWGPTVVLLDEPAAGLSHEDSVALARTLREFSRDNGITMVTVEHDMEIVRELADRVVVLAEGHFVVDGSMEEVSANEDVRKAYLGTVGSK